MSVLSLAMGIIMFQHTAARRRLLNLNPQYRPRLRFNTQPRGGGCLKYVLFVLDYNVSTHSRAEAAANTDESDIFINVVSTHSRAEAAAEKILPVEVVNRVSTHSRAEAAAE